MSALTRELALTVRWSNGTEVNQVVAISGAPLPLEAEAVLGGQEVKGGSAYEVQLRAGNQNVLYAAGVVPQTRAQDPSFKADAWIRCRLTELGELAYEIHLGPAGMDQPKACHKGCVTIGAS